MTYKLILSILSLTFLTENSVVASGDAGELTEGIQNVTIIDQEALVEEALKTPQLISDSETGDLNTFDPMATSVFGFPDPNTKNVTSLPPILVAPENLNTDKRTTPDEELFDNIDNSSGAKDSLSTSKELLQIQEQEIDQKEEK